MPALWRMGRTLETMLRPSACPLKSTVTSRSHPAVATSRASSASAGNSAGTATSDGNMADDSRRAGKPSCPGTTLVRRAPSSGRK